MNGLRPWRENREVLDFASTTQKPVVSGGDRHGFEANAVLNLTNAQSFAEFAAEVRAGWSDILVMRHYREAHVSRIVHNMVDVVGAYERHVNGWRLWSDRVFYRCDDGTVRSLTELFEDGTPLPIAIFLGILQFISVPFVRRRLREAFAVGEEVVL